jgi:hypothetical protein
MQTNMLLIFFSCSAVAWIWVPASFVLPCIILLVLACRQGDGQEMADMSLKPMNVQHLDSSSQAQSISGAQGRERQQEQSYHLDHEGRCSTVWFSWEEIQAGEFSPGSGCSSFNQFHPWACGRRNAWSLTLHSSIKLSASLKTYAKWSRFLQASVGKDGIVCIVHIGRKCLGTFVFIRKIDLGM